MKKQKKQLFGVALIVSLIIVATGSVLLLKRINTNNEVQSPEKTDSESVNKFKLKEWEEVVEENGNTYYINRKLGFRFLIPEEVEGLADRVKRGEYSRSESEPIYFPHQFGIYRLFIKVRSEEEEIFRDSVSREKVLKGKLFEERLGLIPGEEVNWKYGTKVKLFDSYKGNNPGYAMVSISWVPESEYNAYYLATWKKGKNIYEITLGTGFREDLIKKRDLFDKLVDGFEFID